jgi:hypothetical protein
VFRPELKGPMLVKDAVGRVYILRAYPSAAMDEGWMVRFQRGVDRLATATKMAVRSHARGIYACGSFGYNHAMGNNNGVSAVTGLSDPCILMQVSVFFSASVPHCMAQTAPSGRQ